MVLVQKWPFFQLFFLGNVGKENVFYDILERKNAFLGYKNKKLKKSKKLTFFQPMVLVQKWPFFKVFFLGKRGQENIPNDILERKTPFYAIKTRSSKSRNIDIFSKRLNHGFGPKMAIFLNFFWGSIGQKIILIDILEGKNAFLGYKNKKFKKSKN